MSDSSHWIVVARGQRPREVSNEDLLKQFSDLRDCTYLVPGRIWLAFQKDQKRMDALYAELQSFNKPELTLHAPYRPRATPFDHSDHGREELGGPVDPDCPCRATVQQPVCAATGCGFCLAAMTEADRNG